LTSRGRKKRKERREGKIKREKWKNETVEKTDRE
jgi:hypothetical protein